MALMNRAGWQRRVGAETFRDVLLPGMGAESRSVGLLCMSCVGHVGVCPPTALEGTAPQKRGLTLKEASLSHFIARQVEAQRESLAQSPRQRAGR